MSNFKVGEKVVFIGSKKPLKTVNKQEYFKGNQPINNEIVTIEYIYDDGYISIKEYAFDFDEIKQSFNKRFFRKLDHQFSEDVIAEIIKQAKEGSLTLSN